MLHKYNVQRIYQRYFEMAHTIKDHPKCGNVHGHSYNLKIYLNGYRDEWLDFADIKSNVDQIIDSKYDHRFIENCTAEMIAQSIGAELSFKYQWSGEIELYETIKYGVRIDFGIIY